MVKKFVLLCINGKDTVNHFVDFETYAFSYVRVLFFRQSFRADDAIRKFNSAKIDSNDYLLDHLPPFAIEISRDEAEKIGDVENCNGGFIDYNFRAFTSDLDYKKGIGYDWDFQLFMTPETYNISALRDIVRKCYE